MIMDAGMTSSKFMLIFNPSIIASVNSSIFCITITGIRDIIYPNMQLVDVIGLTFKRINRDVFLSLETNIAVNSVKKALLNIITPGVKFSIL